MRSRDSIVLALGLLLSVLAAGCSTTSSSSQYGKARSEPPLEVPPGLDQPIEDESMSVPEGRPGSVTYSSVMGGARPAEKVGLPPQEGLRIERDGAQRWLVVQGEPTLLWPWLLDFWAEQGYRLALRLPVLGIVETDWLERAEDEAPPLRERFRVRIEQAVEPGATEVYLTQHGLTRPGGKGAWQHAPADAERENEMLKRLALYLGAQRAQVERLALGEAGEPRATLVFKAGKELALIVAGDLDGAWTRFGLALDRIGAVIESHDRAQGLYQLRLPARGGDDDEAEPAAERYQLLLRTHEGGVRATLQDRRGKPLATAAAKDLLVKLEQNL